MWLRVLLWANLHFSNLRCCRNISLQVLLSTKLHCFNQIVVAKLLSPNCCRQTAVAKLLSPKPFCFEQYGRQTVVTNVALFAGSVVADVVSSRVVAMLCCNVCCVAELLKCWMLRKVTMTYSNQFRGFREENDGETFHRPIFPKPPFFPFFLFFSFLFILFLF